MTRAGKVREVMADPIPHDFGVQCVDSLATQMVEAGGTNPR